ncbi:hypothetical protein LG047_18285 [Methylocystis sp. WRRC1]|uniref:hypothetical protein n=1 Tax=Methylocystis sp. WRRC1 TaxID=1732014 RepID=UPI001D140FFC|nr:hypothetical protein [Methylocystis sp. WRRC1]MCC3247241.1 hypothetical protein [Methylocystis sp. WRRC1]
MTFEQPMPAGGRLVVNYAAIVNAMLLLLVSLGSFTFIEPSPYDLVLVAFFGVWLLSGFRVHSSIIPLAALVVLGNLMSFISIIPWFHVDDSFIYWAQSLYLSITVIFFAVLFGEDGLRRSDLLLRGYLISCIVAAVVGVIGWLDIGGTAVYFSPEGRAMGPFKDPNVFGSYLIAGYLFLLQRMLLGLTKGVIGVTLSLATILLLLSGVFLSFSRGSWGAAATATVLMSAMTYYIAEGAGARRRLVVIFAIVVAAAVAALLVALSIEQVRDVFLVRASLSQDYDVGETGRFGNQLRSLPMLLELPFGMGPLRFRSFFGLDPHNSYIGAFANAGWLGGFAFLFLIGVSTFVGFRLCFAPSPFRRNAQVVFIALLMFFLQGFQIDIDHWRFVYLLMGGVWGLEAARLRWLEKVSAQEQDTPPARA